MQLPAAHGSVGGLMFPRSPRGTTDHQPPRSSHLVDALLPQVQLRRGRPQIVVHLQLLEHCVLRESTGGKEKSVEAGNPDRGP